MLSCPPNSYVEAHPSIPYPHKAPDMPNSDLMRLLALSQELPFDNDGEITPIMALHMIRTDPLYTEMTVDQFMAVKEELKSVTRCYG